MNCEEFEIRAMLYLYEELPPSECEAIEHHAAECSGCREKLAQARRLNALLAQRASVEATPELVVHCREALEESLDGEQFGWRRLLADWLPRHPSRITATLTLIAFAFGLGWMLRAPSGNMQPAAASPVRLASMGGIGLGQIRSISQVAPDPGGNKVRITVNAEHHVTLEGSLENPGIRQILLDAMRGDGNPGIRLDTLAALRPQTRDPAVEDALLGALRHDPNPGVRLEALGCVQSMNWNPKVQSSVVGAVERDPNSGVRVAAMDDLVHHALDGRDEALLPVLQKLAGNGQNTYVRVKAITALQELQGTR
ncbi:MAG: HEAT repeat domain-containing protein [Terriglobia bacterium]